MKPETSSPDIKREPTPVEYKPGIENIPNISAPESDVQKSAERFEKRSDLSASASNVAGISTTFPTPVVDDTKVVNNNKPASDIPTVAGDDDLIEKEWVDKAKKIVSETRSDPYQQEDSIGKLQVDYIKKRYGKELGTDT